MQSLCLSLVLISPGCRGGKQRGRLITSAVATLCKLFPLNYSSLTYLSARSWSAVEGFKYWKDFTSNNSGARARLQKVTIRQSVTHAQVLSAKLQQQKRIPLHVSASHPVNHGARWKMVNSARASRGIGLPLRFSPLGFLTLYWWETGGWGSEAQPPPPPPYTQETHEFSTGSNCGSRLEEVLTFSDLFPHKHLSSRHGHRHLPCEKGSSYSQRPLLLFFYKLT